MRTIKHPLLFTFSVLLIAASACGEPSVDNDGDKVCGDLVSCSDECIDLTQDPQHCGSCASACRQDQICSSSTCACATGQVDCNGNCINPNTDRVFCGADAQCTGFDACGDGEVCLAGACESTVTYVGSLSASKGRWNYLTEFGIDAANNACAATYGAGMTICTHAQLLAAEARSELVGAVAAGLPVTSVWVDAPDDAGACDDILGAPHPGCQRCQHYQSENIPWTYNSAHLGMKGRFMTLEAATGKLGPLTVGACSDTRFIACCNPRAVEPPN